MLKIYKQYLIKKFLIKYLKICLIFFLLTILLGILEEISFVNGTNKANIILPYYLTLLNIPFYLYLPKQMAYLHHLFPLLEFYYVQYRLII